VLTDPQSGRSLEIRTTQPACSSTAATSRRQTIGRGTVFKRRTGLCLETQHFPDSPNEPAFPSTILRPGEVYSEKTVLAFRVVK